MAMAYLAQYPESPRQHWRTSSMPLICSQATEAAWSHEIALTQRAVEMLEDLQARVDASEGDSPAPLGNTPVSRSSRRTAQRHHVAVCAGNGQTAPSCVRVRQAAPVLTRYQSAISSCGRSRASLVPTAMARHPTPVALGRLTPHSPMATLNVEAFALRM